MNKILLKLICAFTLALGLNTTTKAQLVYIPDSIFRVYLHQNFGSCMVGDYIDSNCPAVLNTKILKINNRGISDLTGVAVFVNDTLLECYGNALTTLPILPPSLTSLNCISNQLTNLSNLPPSLNKLICYNNQLTSISNLPSSLTEFYCDNNQLTSISNLPSSLIRFSCDNNQLTTLPILPPLLINLYCQNNLLTSLPNLPNTLDYLYCENNQLTSLPALPSTLTRLACSANQLTGLPSLPVNIKILNCFNNQLISLPGLVNCNVRILNCSNNQLTTLPTLSGNLEYLTCNNNPLTFIPQLPPSLLGLSCSKTQITSLPGLANLRVLDCHSNQLTSIPSLPPYMTYLECGNNLLTSLPNMPTSIVNLYCDNNMIDSLPPMPQSLRYIDCSHNSLTSLPYFYYSIDSIDCSYNQITSLPFSIYTYFKKIDCSNNLITSVPEFNPSLRTFYCQNNPITCLNKLKGIKTLDISGTLINCLLDYGVVTNCNPPISNFPICDAFNTNGCDLFWNIGGTSFIDSDSNCIIGINEPNYSNQKISLYKNGVFNQFTYTSFAGKYDFNTISYDTYKTEMDTMGKPFKINCPLAGFYLDTITPIDSMKYDRNFGVKCKGVDLAVTNINSNNIRPASIREITIKAGDFSNYFGAHCSMGVSGNVTISITGPCNYHSPVIGALVPNSVIGNVLTYNVIDFGTISYDSSFNFNILVDTTANIGSQICIQVSISTTTSELTINNNLLTQCFIIVGSIDPNDKTAYPNSTLDQSGDRWITYLIRFQNTGTADAEDIYITDTLSQALDWTTFTLLSYSHQPITEIHSDGLVKFNFPKIHLPDSNTNEPASHGYVQYKIRAKDSLAIGSTIENTANIFFDFNAPVITNTTSNTVINCSIPPTIITASICNGAAYTLNGVNYFLDGVFQQKLITNVGCDSIIELQLTVSSITNAVSQSSAILQTTASGLGYQWIDCATNTAISGATNSTYQPTQSGDYAVAVTYGNCIDTSACFSFSMVGLPSSIAGDVIFQTRYHSNADQIHLHAEKLKGNKGVLRLMDISGRIIFQKQIENIATGNLDLEITAKGMNAGIYLVNLITERDNISGKVVKY